ncbi:MAG: carbohydrate kinase family protein [Pirellulales bacterium]
MQESSTSAGASVTSAGSGRGEKSTADVVVAGHICLDIIPQLNSTQQRPGDLFVPGGLVHIGPATVALGGCVANTGQALHQLGSKTRLVGKVGDDLLGKTILESLRELHPSLPESMVVASGEATSYTIVLSPPGVDRGFLHCSGANDTFHADDLRTSAFAHARILHFGYPPLMRSILADAGRSLALRFADAQVAGLLVTLDMAMPAAGSGAAPIDWTQWLTNVLPHVDIFLPSYDELSLLLPDVASDRTAGAGVDLQQLDKFATTLLRYGVPIVVIKLGEQGLYLRTGSQVTLLSRRAAWHNFDWQAWSNRELLAPCFEVAVVGTTGSGDCTIAGFLMALLQGAGPEAALRLATAVGAHCVESADATSGIPSCSRVEARLNSDWPRRPMANAWSHWRLDAEFGVYAAPRDASVVPQTAS